LVADFFHVANVNCWSVSEVVTPLIEVRLVGHSGPDLLALISSHFDPQRTFGLHLLNAQPGCWLPSMAPLLA
jgi:hypothetical protein